MRSPPTAAPLVTAALLLAVTQAALAQSMDDLWAKNCLSCHGQNGQGGGAGTRTMLDDAHRDPTAFPSIVKDGVTGRTHRELFDAIKLGKLDGGMPAFGGALSDGQVWGLVNYIRELQEKARRADGSPDVAPKPGKDGITITKRAIFRIQTVIGDTKADGDGGPLNLDTPWSVDFLPAGSNPAAGSNLKTLGDKPARLMFLTERSGKLHLLDSAAAKPATTRIQVSGVPKVRNRGQGGLMDVAIDPDYTTSGWIYLTFSDELQKDGKSLGMTKVIRAKLKPTSSGDGLELADQQTLFQAKPEHYVATDLHFGSRIVFGKVLSGSGKDTVRELFFCIGERGQGEKAQNLSLPNGKVYRIGSDGSTPSDNPFVGTKDAYGQIWSYGHRNPQGLCMDAAGNLFDTEHGPRGGDELNLITKASNYGWPVVSFGINYNGTQLTVPWPELAGKKTESLTITQPILAWLPSIAACGLDAMRTEPGKATTAPGQAELFPGWRGDLFAGGLAGNTVERLRIENGKLTEREEIIHGMGRVRDVVAGPDGALYIVLNDPDNVIRLVTP